MLRIPRGIENRVGLESLALSRPKEVKQWVLILASVQICFPVPLAVEKRIWITSFISTVSTKMRECFGAPRVQIRVLPIIPIREKQATLGDYTLARSSLDLSLQEANSFLQAMFRCSQHRSVLPYQPRLRENLSSRLRTGLSLTHCLEIGLLILVGESEPLSREPYVAVRIDEIETLPEEKLPLPAGEVGALRVDIPEKLRRHRITAPSGCQ